jgi:hypothetical protein
VSLSCKLLAWEILFDTFEAHSPRAASALDLYMRWHGAFVSILTDLRTMEECVADRLAPQSEEDQDGGKLRALREWASSPASRRAVLHAAAVRRLFDCIPRSREPALHVFPSVYHATMVLQVWAFLSPHANGAGESPMALDRIDELHFPNLELFGVTFPYTAPSSLPEAPLYPEAVRFITHGGPATLEGISLRDFPGISLAHSSPKFGRGLTKRMRRVLDALAELKE